MNMNKTEFDGHLESDRARGTYQIYVNSQKYFHVSLENNSKFIQIWFGLYGRLENNSKIPYLRRV